MKTFFLSTFVALFLCAAPVQAQSAGKRVALIISSYGTQNPELSYDLEELAQAYLVLSDHGITLDIISPAGGAVPVKTHKDGLPYIQRFKQQTPALQQLAATVAAKDADPKAYQGVLIVGGAGAMMDLPMDAGIQQLLTALVADQRAIAAVCHGPAALVDVTTGAGNYFVAGKRVCSFTNVEEQAFSSEALASFPFLIEDKMRERGALFTANAPMLPFVAVDGDLITAQNPGSVAQAAEALVHKLGLPLKSRRPFKDEATMALLAKARVSGPFLIDLAIATAPDDYDRQYLGLYAFYSYRLAQTDADKRTELGLMEAAARHFSHPMLQEALVRAQHEQGFGKKAKVTLAALAKTHPDHANLDTLKSLVGADK